MSYKNIKPIIHKYRFQSVYFQYFRKILIWFSIPCLVFCMIICVIYTSSYYSSKKYDCIISFQKSLNNLDNIFMDVNKKFEVFQENNSLKNYIQLDEDSFYSARNYNLITDTNKLIKDTLNVSAFIDSIYLYSFKNNYVTALSKFSGVGSNFLENFNDMQWFDEYEKEPNGRSVFKSKNNKGQEFVMLMYEIADNNKPIGIVVYGIETKNFMDFIVTGQISENETVFLTDNRNEVVFSNAEIAEEYIPNVSFNDVTEDIIVEKYKGNRLLCSSKLKNAVLKFNILNEYNDSSKLLLRFSIAGILLFVILLPIFFSFVLSNKVFNSIAMIVKNLQGFDNVDTDSVHQNELKYIIFNIKKLAEDEKKLERELALSISQLKQTQIIALQSQLNPHFLFNTLNSLTLLNNKISSREFSILVRNLSNLLSYALDYSGNVVTMESEIEYAKYYISIEEIKYQAHINIVWEIPRECCECNVIRFLLQPIIENSLMHGFRRSWGEKEIIRVNAEQTDDGLVISVIDNGVGMPEDKLEKLNNDLKNGVFPNKKHIGLCNLNKRIQLLYGDRYGCSVKSVENNGVTVVILLPNL